MNHLTELPPYPESITYHLDADWHLLPVPDGTFVHLKSDAPIRLDWHLDLEPNVEHRLVQADLWMGGLVIEPQPGHAAATITIRAAAE